ncbi:hypothetical protein CEXT_280041 [Caerostris extrusa]|uniref:Uncharacterized protein n=1 Tax=Caerostris extrusa TaxID=172846 RepID=A0AAV4NXW7_CAEEX|nr:hypothetical protein CEXT_280041 [Caerostris extrusa]
MKELVEEIYISLRHGRFKKRGFWESVCSNFKRLNLLRRWLSAREVFNGVYKQHQQQQNIHKNLNHQQHCSGRNIELTSQLALDQRGWFQRPKFQERERKRGADFHLLIIILIRDGEVPSKSDGNTCRQADSNRRVVIHKEDFKKGACSQK